jgi:hypothetical protein
MMEILKIVTKETHGFKCLLTVLILISASLAEIKIKFSSAIPGSAVKVL